MHNKVLLPALMARLDVEVIEKKKTMAEHEAKAADAASGVSARQRANDAIGPQTPYIAALEKVRMSMEEYFGAAISPPFFWLLNSHFNAKPVCFAF